MILVLKENYDKKQLDNLVEWLKGQNFDIHLSEGAHTTIMGLIGDTSALDIDMLTTLNIVESAKRIVFFGGAGVFN